MTSAHIIMLITIAIYLIGMVAIGIYCSKDNETVGDFYLGGRKMGPIVTAMSAEAAAFVCVNLFLGSAAMAGSFFVLLDIIVALII